MSEFLSTIVMFVIMWFGGQLVLNSNNSLTAQEFIGYILIFSQIIPPARSLTTSYYYIQKGSASAQRVYEILDAKPQINKHAKIKPIKKINTSIEFKNVSFSYENREILKNINFKIKKGEIVALVGESGSGKSTITDLLAFFYAVDKGEILIDNNNIKNLNISDLRNLFGIVHQSPLLFNDTILNNIKLGKLDATKKEIITAAKIANAHNFILKTERGYDTKIGDQGHKLSGGEKQRVSIARAILKNPAVLILDEATSALDSKAEKNVQEALSQLINSRTSLVITHRLSTIQNADKILVLAKGKIVEQGSHKELITKNSLYKKLNDLQSLN